MKRKENRHTLRAGQETGDAANRVEKKKSGGTFARIGNLNQKRLSRLELTGVAWGLQHGSPAESTRTDRANSQQGNPAENTRSDQMKGGANSLELAAAAASAQEQNGERT
jgi:hypothetical protein